MIDEGLRIEQVILTQDDPKAAEIQNSFQYDDYQVVRKELFAHLRDACAVIRRDSITFNASCINNLEEVVFVQFLVNPKEHRLVVRPCSSDAKDAVQWCIERGNHRKSRKVTGKPFAAKIYSMMEWDIRCRYKILGHRILIDGELLYIFELDEPEIFLDLKPDKTEPEAEASGMTQEEYKTSKKDLQKKNRKPYYPKQWESSFGVPVLEHKDIPQVDIEEYYAPSDDKSILSQKMRDGEHGG